MSAIAAHFDLLLSIVQRFLQSLVDLPLSDLALAQRLSIGTPIRYRKPKRSSHSIFFSLFHFPALLFHLFAFFRFALFCCLVRIVGFRVPVEVFAFLPPSHWCHERVAQVVFALRVAFDVLPFEVYAAARAFFSYGLEEVHGGRIWSSKSWTGRRSWIDVLMCRCRV
jgi:hypothetical protein